MCDGSADQDQRTSFSKTYLVLDTRDNALVGYCSILTDAILTDAILTDAIRLQGKERPDGVSYGSAPAIKLGRMGVDKKDNGSGNDCGGFILRYVIGLARRFSQDVGVRYVTLDALPAPKLVAWYEKNGFVRNQGERRAQKILREGLRFIKRGVELPHVSMRYDILLEEELPA